MTFFKNPWTLITILITCIIIYYLANTQGIFGKFINRFLPCEQNPYTSFPCYSGYDIAIMSISVVIGVACLTALTYFLYKQIL